MSLSSLSHCAFGSASCFPSMRFRLVFRLLIHMAYDREMNVEIFPGGFKHPAEETEYGLEYADGTTTICTSHGGQKGPWANNQLFRFDCNGAKVYLIASIDNQGIPVGYYLARKTDAGDFDVDYGNRVRVLANPNSDAGLKGGRKRRHTRRTKKHSRHRTRRRRKSHRRR